MNAKDKLDLLRDVVNEATAAHWSDVNLMRRINLSQRKVANIVAMYPGQWLVVSASVTPVASVITLPPDCSKPVYLEETSSGTPVEWLNSVAYRRLSRSKGTSLDVGYLEAHPEISTLVVNRDSYTEACTLWYQIRVPDLVAGTAAAGAETSLTFPDDRVSQRVADYYNNVKFDPVSGTGAGAADTITDYSTSRVATVTGTYDATTVFGTISRLPEETHHWILAEAVMMTLSKRATVIDKDILGWHREALRDTRRDCEAWLETRIIEKTGVTVGDTFS
jgi:hypothetical protein